MADLSKLSVVRNPASGRGRWGGRWPEIEAQLRRVFPDVQVVETTGPGSARDQARALAEKGCEVVVAAGGDGTVRDVLEGILGTDAALGALPMGTGNDLLRTLGIGASMDKAVEALAAGNRLRIDVASWRRDGAQGVFVNVAGCGFDAVVADRINMGYRFLHGTSAYVAAVFGTLANFRPCVVHLVVDGEKITDEVMLCAFANARSYGGGMQIAPVADLTDGLLDLVIVQSLGKASFIRSFPSVFRGAHLAHPKVQHRTFRKLSITCEGPMPFLLDGEVLPPGPLEIEVIPKAIDVIAPAP